MVWCFEMKLNIFHRDGWALRLLTLFPHKQVVFFAFRGTEEKSCISLGSPIFSLPDIVACSRKTCTHQSHYNVKLHIGLKPGQNVHGKLVNSAFFALILAVKTSSKELISEPFEMTTRSSKKRKDNFFLAVSSTHLHMDLRTICFLTRFTVQYGTIGKKAEYKKCSVTLYYPPFAFP